jgi:hypothetical protein
MASAAEAVARHLGTDRGAASRLARAVGMSRGFVSNVLAGRVVPSDPVRWADGLGLAGAARAAFLRDLASDRQSPEVQAAIAMREAAPTTTAELDRLAPGIVEATARIAALERELAGVRACLAAIARLAGTTARDPTAEDNLAATEAAQRAPTRHDEDQTTRRTRGPLFKVPPRVHAP